MKKNKRRASVQQSVQQPDPVAQNGGSIQAPAEAPKHSVTLVEKTADKTSKRLTLPVISLIVSGFSLAVAAINAYVGYDNTKIVQRAYLGVAPHIVAVQINRRNHDNRVPCCDFHMDVSMEIKNL